MDAGKEPARQGVHRLCSRQLNGETGTWLLQGAVAEAGPRALATRECKAQVQIHRGVLIHDC